MSPQEIFLGAGWMWGIIALLAVWYGIGWLIVELQERWRNRRG